MRKTLSNHLQYSWWIYLLTAVCIIVAWVSVFSALARPKPNQKLTLSFVGQQFDSDSLQEHVANVLPSLTEQCIKQVYAESLYTDTASTLGSLLATRTLSDTDLFVFSESMLKDGVGQTYCAPLDKEIIRRYLGEVTFYEENGEAYGILICDGSNPTNFSQFYSENEKCWAFVSINSVNAASANGKGNPVDDAALMLVKYLMEDSSVI